MARTGPGLQNESTGDLIRRTLQDLQELLDKQVALVKLELREDVHQLVKAGKTLGIGLGLLMAAGICFFDFLFHGINTLFPGWGWVAALVATLVFGIAGAILAKRGREEVKVQPLSRTRETLKEDAAWVKHPLTHNGRSSTSATTSRRPSPS